MKALCQRDALLAAFQLANAAISTRDVKPILKDFKVIADHGRFTLMATDMELGIRLDVMGIQVLDAGEAMLPAQRLFAILRETPPQAELSIEADAAGCTVQGEDAEFEMAGQ